jgi:SM-20-related protein
MKLTREYDVHGRKLLVFDDFLSAEEVQSVYTFFKGVEFVRKQSDSDDIESYKYWVRHLPTREFSNLDFVKRVDDLIDEHLDLPAKNRPTHFYCNAVSYGDVGFPHRDRDKSDGITVLLYVNDKWDPKWGGETIFFDDNEDPIYCVLPKPARLVVFDSYILHKFGVPARICYEARYTLALKYWADAVAPKKPEPKSK